MPLQTAREMPGLLDQLVALTSSLRCVVGDDLALYRLRVWHAAKLILEDPSLLPFDRGAYDGEIVAPAEEGERLAHKLAAGSASIAIVEVPFYDIEPRANRSVESVGPFWTALGGIVRFDILKVRRSDWCFLARRIAPAPRQETLLVLPRTTRLAADGLTLDIGRGTIWIAAKLLVPATVGFVGLRIRSAHISFANALPAPANRRWVIANNARWRLNLTPEQPAPASPDALGFGLPRELEIAHDGTVTIGGSGLLQMPGETVTLAPATSPAIPTAIGGGIRLPLALDPVKMQLSVLSLDQARFSGEQRILSASWLLPFAIETQPIGEAEGGGAIELTLGSGSGAIEVGEIPKLQWPAARLRLSGTRATCLALPATGLGSVAISTWQKASSRFGFGSGPKAAFVSLMPDGQFSLIAGPGRLSNRWNLPKAADNSVVQMSAGNQAILGLNRLADRSYLTTLHADAPVAALGSPLHGLCLPNAFVTVSDPRRLRAGGRGNRMLALDDGLAWLTCDGGQLEPMLPDPYASNWVRNRRNRAAGLGTSRRRGSGALDVTLTWRERGRPTVLAQINDAFGGPAAVEHADAGEIDQRFWAAATGHGEIAPADFRLMDLSSHAQQFGISIEKEGLGSARLDRGSRLSFPMDRIRLLLQPQVHWEAVSNRSSPPPAKTIKFKSQGMPAFLAAPDRKLTAALPSEVARNVVVAAQAGSPAVAVFSLPFGLRAYAILGLDSGRQPVAPARAQIHEPGFKGKLIAATQIRLSAQESSFPGQVSPPEELRMAGAMKAVPPPVGSDVLAAEIRKLIDGQFGSSVPLHQVDLSGYGLSTFSRWRHDPPDDEDYRGVSQVRFDVIRGRTSYEVIQVRSYLVCPLCRVVRTIVFDRANSGVVERFDSGWKAIEDGEFKRFGIQFEKGLVKRFANIRNIRILDEPWIKSGAWEWQKVLYDADGHIGDPQDILMPVRGHVGYIPVAPATELDQNKSTPDELTAQVLSDLFEQVGPIGGPLDGHLDLAKTLALHATGMFADRAPNGTPNPGFVVAVNGTPTLPSQGDWNCVRINPAGDVAVVDPKRGVPIIRSAPNDPYRFREPTSAYQQGDDFGLMMVTESARVLFSKPTIDPDEVGKVRTEAPELADPYALSQAIGLMPPPSRRLVFKEPGVFEVAGKDWRLVDLFTAIKLPDPALAGASKWQLARAFEPNPQLAFALDSVSPITPWKLERTGKDILKLSLPGFPDVLSLIGKFAAEFGKPPSAEKPDVQFGKALEELRSIIDALDHFIDLPLPFDIDVKQAPGPTPAFDVVLHLRLRIPGTANERIDIGVGKFSGQFDLRGKLRASIGGPASGELQLAFEGDIQQGILPPALYAGGYFRFAITISDSADPRVELGLATTASIGGDLIPKLVELEVTVRYGYTLIPETLEPGVLLGLEARAKLLSGLLGVSFRTDAMGRIQRPTINNVKDRNVTIFAELRVIATVEALWGLAKDEEELHTQFEQQIPLAPIAVIAGVNPLLLATELL